MNRVEIFKKLLPFLLMAAVLLALVLYGWEEREPVPKRSAAVLLIDKSTHQISLVGVSLFSDFRGVKAVG